MLLNQLACCAGTQVAPRLVGGLVDRHDPARANDPKLPTAGALNFSARAAHGARELSRGLASPTLNHAHKCNPRVRRESEVRRKSDAPRLVLSRLT